MRTVLCDNFRLRLLKLFLASGIGTTTFFWWWETRTNYIAPIDRLGYPAVIVIFAASLIVLYLRPAAEMRIAHMNLAILTLYIVLQTQPLALEGASIHICTRLVFWLPLGYAAAFFVLETRRAIMVSSLMYLASLGPLLLQGIAQNTGILRSDEWFLLLNMCFAQPLFIATLAGIAYHKAHSANTDYLTGIPNRRSVTQILEEQLCAAQRARQPLSFIFLDVDHFKHINDSFGHDVGDQVLIEVSKALRQHLRHTDYVGRWGGEEFIIIATSTTATDAAVLAERLRWAITERLYPPVGRVTLSLGVATATLNDTSQTLVKRADTALYQAKQHGRNRVEIVLTSTSA